MRVGKYVFKDKTGTYEINPTKAQLGIYISHLQKENAVLEKALELACENVITLQNQSCSSLGKCKIDCEECYKRHYIQQAEKEGDKE